MGWIHLFFAIAALVGGAFIVVRPKGTRIHRYTGYSYVVSMAGLNVTALLIYRLSGNFGPFHVAAVISLGTVAAGVIVALRRSSADWVRKHYKWMTWSYVGLLAATVSEVLTRVPSAPFWWAVLLGSVAVFVGGGFLIRTNEAESVKAFVNRE